MKQVKRYIAGFLVILMTLGSINVNAISDSDLIDSDIVAEIETTDKTEEIIASENEENILVQNQEEIIEESEENIVSEEEIFVSDEEDVLPSNEENKEEVKSEGVISSEETLLDEDKIEETVPEEDTKEVSKEVEETESNKVEDVENEIVSEDIFKNEVDENIEIKTDDINLDKIETDSEISIQNDDVETKTEAKTPPIGVGTTDSNVLETAFLTYEKWSKGGTSAVTVSGNYADADYVGEVLVNLDCVTETVDCGDMVFSTNDGISTTTNWVENGGLPWITQCPSWLNVKLSSNEGILYVKFVAKQGVQQGQTGKVKLEYGASLTVIDQEGSFTELKRKAIGNIIYTVTIDGENHTDTSKPEKPTINDLPSSSDQNGYVDVKCVTYPNSNPHNSASRKHSGYVSLKNSTAGWSFGEVYANDGRFGEDAPKEDYPYLCDLTIDKDWYLNLYNKTYSKLDGTHYINDSNETVSTTFVSDGNKWYFFTEDFPLTVWTTHKKQTINADYRVEWYDASNNKLLKSETRNDAIGNTVQVKESDKIIEGYTFDAENENNILSEVLTTETVLKLYFTNNDPVPDTIYTMIREYRVNGEMIASVTIEKEGFVGEEILGDNLVLANPNWAERTVEGEKLIFEYSSSTPSTLVLVKDASKNVITLKYEHNEQEKISPLIITKQVDKEIADIGYILTYTITVQNNKNVTHTDIVIKDVLDSEYLKWESASLIWNSPNIESPNNTYVYTQEPIDGMYHIPKEYEMTEDTEVILTIKAKILKSGTIFNSAYVSSNKMDSTESNEVKTIVPEIPTYNYSLTWDYNGGKVGNDSTRTKTESTTDNNYTFYDNALGFGSPLPEREDYTFQGWSYSGDGIYNSATKQIVMSGLPDETVSGTLTAIWEKIKTITVTWIDEDKKTILDGPKTFTKGEDEPPYEKDLPTKQEDEYYTYEFAGWEEPVIDDEGNIIYYAKYEPTPKELIVSWYDEDKTTYLDTNTFLKTENEPSYSKELPTKEADEKYTYVFKEWILQETPLNDDDISYVASYTPISKKYDYTIKHQYYTDGKLDGTETVSDTLELDEILISSDIEKLETYKDNIYQFFNVDKEKLVITSSEEENVITFRYDRFTYKVIHKYLDSDGNLIDSLEDSFYAFIGDEITSDSIGKKLIHNGKTYDYVSDSGNLIILDTFETNVIEIVYQEKELLPNEITYTVKWFDIDNHLLKEEIRYGFIDDIKVPNDSDYKIKDYTFIEDYKDNILSITLKEDVSKNILILYFDKNIKEEKFGSYEIEHQYYVKDKNGNLKLEGNLKETISNVKVGTVIYSSSIARKYNYNGKTHELLSDSGNITILTDSVSSIIIKYVRTEEETNITVTETEEKNPPKKDETSSKNEETKIEEIVVLPDEETPLAVETVKTGDTAPVMMLFGLMVLSGIGIYFFKRKRK